MLNWKSPHVDTMTDDDKYEERILRAFGWLVLTVAFTAMLCFWPRDTDMHIYGGSVANERKGGAPRRVRSWWENA